MKHHSPLHSLHPRFHHIFVHSYWTWAAQTMLTTSIHRISYFVQNGVSIPPSITLPRSGNGARTDQEQDRARLSRSRVSQAKPAGLSVSSGQKRSQRAGSRWHVRYTETRLGANAHAARPVLLRASHENARRHEVTSRCLTRHEPALSAQSFILHWSPWCLNSTDSYATRWPCRSFALLPSTRLALGDTSNIFTQRDSPGGTRTERTHNFPRKLLLGWMVLFFFFFGFRKFSG